jgi:dTDP-glucose 4,6-dehydratase
VANFIVAGGAGFIGSEFVRLISSLNHQVIVVDSLTYAGDLERIENLANVQVIQADILNINDFSTDITKTFSIGVNTYLVNFAAESHVDRSIASGFDFYKTNVLGTQVLLEFASRIKLSKFVQVGTDEVYGSLSTGEADENYPIETNSAYSASKAGADLAVLAHFKTHGLNMNITRACNTYGKYQYPEKLIPRSIVLSLSNLPIEIYGNGTQVREWIAVEDHALGILKVCESGVSGEIYNLGTGARISNLDLVTGLASLLEESGLKPSISFVNDRPGHDVRYALNSEKARKHLNWNPEGFSTQSLRSTLNWYLENENWWKKHLSNSERISYK